jgi:hypothetical protein
MKECRFWQIEVEPDSHNVFEVFPKADDFLGKLEYHLPPRLVELGATSTEVH